MFLECYVFKNILIYFYVFQDANFQRSYWMHLTILALLCFVYEMASIFIPVYNFHTLLFGLLTTPTHVDK